MYDLSELVNVISFLPEGMAAGKLYGAFSGQRSRCAGVFWVILQTVSFFAFTGNTENTALIKLLIYLAAMILFSACCCEGKPAQRIFPAVQFIAVRELSVHSVNIISFLGGLVSSGIAALACRGDIPAESGIALIGICGSVSTVLMIISKAALIYAAVNRLTAGSRCTGGSLTVCDKGAAVFMLPPAAGIAVSALIRQLLITIEDGYTVTVYNRYPLMYLIVPAISLLLLLSVVMTFGSYREMAALQAERAERVILENQITGLQASVSESEELYENVRSVRHDMKNNMSVLRSLLADRLPDDEEIRQFFGDMDLAVEQLDSRIRTGSAVSDTVIGNKFRHAEKNIRGIELDADNFIFCGADNIRPYDLGVILGNILDNAIEACARLREKDPCARTYIGIRSYKVKNMYFVEAENSFDGELVIGGDGLPVSSKADEQLHGAGLRSVKKCAEKYSGCLDFTARGGKFTVTVMLKFR